MGARAATRVAHVPDDLAALDYLAVAHGGAEEMGVEGGDAPAVLDLDHEAQVGSLFHALDEKKSRPLIWLSGPAGSGKTTLVASYLQARKIPCLWYRMDEGDGNLATFFYYLGLAGKKAAPRIRKPLPLLTSEYLQGIPVFALRFFENLFGRLKKPVFLVFYLAVVNTP